MAAVKVPYLLETTSQTVPPLLHSAKLASQIFSPQMGVAFKHLQRLVARDGGYLHRIEAPLEESARRLNEQGNLCTLLIRSRVTTCLRRASDTLTIFSFAIDALTS